MMISLTELEKTSTFIIEQLREKGFLKNSEKSDSTAGAVQVVLNVLTDGLSKLIYRNELSRKSPGSRNATSPASKPQYDVKSGPEILFQLLYDWCPVYFFDNGNCCIAGHIIVGENYRLYRTNLIDKVLDRGRKFRDDDGKYFELCGELCEKTYDKIAELEGILRVESFPDIFLKSFHEGIPSNWRDVIKETTAKLLGIHKRSSSTIEVQDDDSIDCDAQLEPQTESPSKQPLTTNGQQNSKEEKFIFDIVSGSPTHSKIVSAGCDKVHVNRLKHRDIELSKCLTRTRSGRLVKPVLDTWRGQKITETTDGRMEVSLGTYADKVGLRMMGILPNREDSGYGSIGQMKRRMSQISSSMVRKRLTFSSDSDEDSPLVRRLMKTASQRRMKDVVDENSFKKVRVTAEINRSETTRIENHSPVTFSKTTARSKESRPKMSVTTPLPICSTKFDEVRDYDDAIIVLPDSPVACSSTSKEKCRAPRRCRFSVDLDKD